MNSTTTENNTIDIAFTLNGESKSLRLPPTRRLLDVLREDLGLTGSKEGCGEGECGACSVFIDGAVVNSCLVPVAQVSGSEVVSIEGIATGPRGDELHTVQDVLLEYGGTQCGICTPGIVMSVVAAVQANSHSGTTPNPDQIREQIAGNLCRCTGYQLIVDAAIEAASRMAGNDANPLKVIMR